MLTAKDLLKQLPPLKNESVLIVQDQKVSDIIRQILTAHERNAHYYDAIALDFDGKDVSEICDNLVDFISHEIKYKQEPESKQTVAIPASILTNGYGDCKHYSSFAGGVLDALTRLTGKKIDWCYRFVSYNYFSRQPHHVFVVVFDGDEEIWIDPVPGADKHSPVWQLDKKVKASNMALHDIIAGVGDVQTITADSFFESDEFDYAVAELVKYNLVNLQTGAIDNETLLYLLQSLPEDEATNLQNAIAILNAGSQAIGYTLGEKILHAAAKVPMALGRGAFLLMLRWNVRAWAKNIDYAVATKGAAASDPIGKKWYLLGGDADPFWSAVREGRDKKMLGNVPDNTIGMTGAEIIAAITAAAPIILAMVPIIKSLLNVPPDWEPGQVVPGMTPTTGGSGTLPPSTTTGNKLIEFIKANPIPVAIAAGGIVWYLTKDGKKIMGTKDNNTLLWVGLGLGAIYLFSKKDAAPGTEEITVPGTQPTNIFIPPTEIPEPLPANPTEEIVVRDPEEMDYAYRDSSLYNPDQQSSDSMYKVMNEDPFIMSTQQFL